MNVLIVWSDVLMALATAAAVVMVMVVVWTTMRQRYTFPTESSLSCPVKAGDVYSQCVRMGLDMGTTTGR